MIAFSFLAGARRLATFSVRDLFSVRKRVREGRAYQNEILKKCSFYIAPAPIAHAFMSIGQVDSSKIIDLTYGLPAHALRQTNDHPKRARSETLIIGFFGGSQRRKGLQVLIDAFCCIPENYPAKLWISTSSPNVQWVFRYVHERSTAFSFVKDGRISVFLNEKDDRYFARMREVDLAVIPTLYYECTPLVLLEVLAQGTPCIVSEGPGMNHIVNPGVSGASFPPNNPEALRALLVEIINDPARLEIWRKNLYRPFSMDEYARRLEPILRDLATGKNA